MNLHLGWVGPKKTPPHAFKAFELAKSIAKLCNVMLHEGEDIIRPSWREKISQRNLRPQMISDIQRHEILKEYGGLWIDLDICLIEDPINWASYLSRYTIIKVFDYHSIYGSDIIYVPENWDGWDIIEDHIENVLNSEKIGIFDIAGDMTKVFHEEYPELFSAINPGTFFPFDPRKFNIKESLLTRGFKPPRHLLYQ